MIEKIYVVEVYNPATGETESVEVTKEVFETYRRSNWSIKNGNKRFYKNEIQMSSLVSDEYDGYDGFHEFINRDADPQEILARETVSRTLSGVLHTLSPKDYDLIYALYIDNMSEEKYARSRGCMQQTVHNKKIRILKKLRNLLETGSC